MAGLLLSPTVLCGNLVRSQLPAGSAQHGMQVRGPPPAPSRLPVRCRNGSLSRKSLSFSSWKSHRLVLSRVPQVLPVSACSSLLKVFCVRVQRLTGSELVDCIPGAYWNSSSQYLGLAQLSAVQLGHFPNTLPLQVLQTGENS